MDGERNERNETEDTKGTRNGTKIALDIPLKLPLFHLARRSREIKERDGVYPPCSLLASTSRSVSITKSCEITGRLSPAARPPVIFVVPCSTSFTLSSPPSLHLCPFTDGSHSWTKRGALSADQNGGWKERERERESRKEKRHKSIVWTSPSKHRCPTESNWKGSRIADRYFDIHVAFSIPRLLFQPRWLTFRPWDSDPARIGIREKHPRILAFVPSSRFH